MIKNEVLIQSPTRIDFSGGTLDCWPINALLSPVTTINFAISIFTTCRLSRRDDQRVHLHSRELNKSFEFESVEALIQSNDGEVSFFREHVSYWNPDFGFNLSLQSDSPVGGGLGGSSSLSVSVFKAFAQMYDQEPTTAEIVNACAGIEAKILKMPTGTQDYIPAILGGMNVIDYHYGQFEITNYTNIDMNLNDHISIFFTGKSHFSGINNWQVLKKFIDGDQETTQALEKIKAVSQKMKTALVGKDLAQLPELFREEYQARMMLAESFSSPEIEALTKVALANGADAVKICGAGGGGSVFVWSPPAQRAQVIAACQEAGFQHLDVQLV